MRSLLWSVSCVVCAVVLNGCVFASSGRGPAVENIPVGACNPTPCAHVTIETLTTLPDTFPPQAKTAIYNRIDQSLYQPIDETTGELSRSAFLKSVREQYEDYLKVKDPDVVVEWNVTRSASVLFVNESLLSVRVRSVGYLGGAHGFNDETLLVFEAKTGRVLTWSDVISSNARPIFMRAAEAEFKRARGLRPTQSLTEAGFTFEDGAPFGLPTNFALTEKGVLCHYNPYEVGPYVMGPTEFMVPMDVVAAALNSNETALKALAAGDKRLL